LGFRQIIIVSHGSFIKNTLRWITNKLHTESISCGLGNCKISRVMYHNNHFNLMQSPNNTHLLEFKESLNRGRINNIMYGIYSYPTDHQVFTQNSNLIDIAIDNNIYNIKIDSADQQCYKIIVKLVDTDMYKVINRKYSVKEQYGLLVVANNIVNFLKDAGLIVELKMDSNNAQQHIESETFPMIIIGKEDEPNMLSLNIIYQEVPSQEFLCDLEDSGSDSSKNLDKENTI
ncbi:MAG: hypothetical protein O7C56_08345, partial [Rickettsia endosymbiont of Ixodes persulcatus]|nr:hypothetical protein [Rickettsia endosymbiont of Ixodes persulcatus]